MNEYQRRLLDVVKYSSYIGSFADPGREVLAIEPYSYSVDQQNVNITSAAAQSFNLIMNSDSDFVATLFSGGARIPAATFPRAVEFTPSLLIQITDQASGKTYFNAPTPLGLIAGAGGFPFILSSPRIIRARTTLAISAQGAVAGATFADFYFTIHGAKIYYASQGAKP